MSATAADPQPFDICGPLPTGVTVLEASAGTGKTFTIAALAARYVADGIPLDQLLLVTFTRMATGELRERVRERLVSAEQALTRTLAGELPDPHDEVATLLADAPERVVVERRDNLSRALSSFDAATIATTHGFCQEVLSGLGVIGDVEPGTTLVENVDDLVEEVVDDLYVRRFHRGGERRISRGQALEIARVAIANPATRIEPADAHGDSPDAMRVRLAHAARREVEARKRRHGLMTYDDLLVRLNETLARPGGEAAAERLRRRFRVVLVDEFQDTDPVQWDILRRAFLGGDVTLVLIGDPKQAIYAFRGADVYAYLQAAATAGTRQTLGVNWRSDQGLIDAYDALFAGAKLGHEGIVYRSVRACDANQAPRLVGAPCTAPLRIRVVHRDEPSIRRTQKGFAAKDSAREHIARDLAADLVRLLRSEAEIEIRAEDGSCARREPIRPGHVAVLVRTHRTAALVRDALEEAGVPAVINGAGSVFGTRAAQDWLRLLEAIERPASPQRARAAALTPFLGWTADRVATAGDEEWEELHRRLHVWARILRLKGVASLMEAITLWEGLPQRVLRELDGERRLTDLRHVAQLLHQAATTEHLGTTALAAWLRQRIAAAEKEADEERSRRLESDEAAVQVLTIHRSKGLEFPVVYCPFLWEPGHIPSGMHPVFFHDPEAGDARTIDVGLAGRAFPRHQEQHKREQRGEDLRLAYVALTRARHQAVVWWAASADSRHSPLGRLLFARDESGDVPPSGRRTPSDAEAWARFEQLAAEAPGRVSVERATIGAPVTWPAPPAEAGELVAARFDRTIDGRWRRTSYSDLVAGAHDALVASEPEDDGVVTDEDLAAGPAVAAPGALPGPAGRAPATAPAGPPASGVAAPEGSAASAEREGEEAAAPEPPLARMPSGVRVGTFVHGVLEAADFAAADLDAELAEQVARMQARRRVDAGPAETVVAGLRAALETPLGPLAGDLRLRDVTRANRLDELAFELPLAGGDTPSGRVTLDAVAGVLRRHLPPDHPLAGYPDRLADPGLRQEVRGYLTGTIDLVVRLPGGAPATGLAGQPGGEAEGGGASGGRTGDTARSGGEPRFAIVDYKTNWLAPPGEALSVWHHHPAVLAAEMQRSHYVLQGLLYAVALHRYLRWRLPGYDPDRHLGGILYLFLRGMVGPETPRVDGAPCGVFAWRPSGALIAELSDVLDGGGAA